MPYFKENSIVYLIEDIIAEPSLFNDIVSSLVSGCKCAIIDSPFTSTVTSNGFTVERVIGVGSVICEAGCKQGNHGKLLASPAWGQGRIVKRGIECLYYGAEEYRVQLAGLGLRVKDADFRTVIEETTKYPKRGIIFLDNDADPLHVEEAPGLCGVLGTTNPLHPAAAFGKPKLHGCAKPIYKLVGPLERLATPLLYIEESSNPVISKIEGLGSAAIIHTDPSSATRHIQLATWLGILYECGTSEEYM
jgi:hypothetical protein